ncbi:2-phospho-L-lactate guanylyltransferase [Bounagaea algeriensis]
MHFAVPVKPLGLGKTRLHGAADAGAGHRAAHSALVAALVLDTVLAARSASGVADVTVVTSDPALRALFREHGVRTCPDAPEEGLNAALRHGAEQALRHGAHRVGALQADLPALRPAELDAALRAAGGARAFCPDRHGTGTTMLVAARGEPLAPHFGPSSAAAHARSGAKTLTGSWSSLRCDVDTVADLEHAARLGLGEHTRRALVTAVQDTAAPENAAPEGAAPDGTAPGPPG